MRHEHAPAIAKPFVEVDFAFGRIGVEIWCGIAQSQTHIAYSIHCCGAWWRDYNSAISRH
jgi:hypothetical protein